MTKHTPDKVRDRIENITFFVFLVIIGAAAIWVGLGAQALLILGAILLAAFATIAAATIVAVVAGSIYSSIVD